MNFTQNVFAFPYFDWLCRGVVVTLLVTTMSSVLAAAIAVLLLRCRLSARRPLEWAAILFVVLFRNMPLIPLLLFLAYGVPHFWASVLLLRFPRGLEFYLLILGLALNAAAYLSEILKAGIGAVGEQQVEAARILGMKDRAIRRFVVYPQALRISAPALATRFIHNMKNSSLAVVVPLPVGLMDVVGQAGRIAGQTFSWAEPLIFAACVHLVLSLGLGKMLNGWADREHFLVRGVR